ncbi:Ras GTPase-activating protein 1 [Coemansia sp. Benny D160-2]|nr:Ras GTPase-activating protein 1 [Coemansia sp. Benny D160-2]
MTRSFVDSSSSANALSKIKRAISTYRLHDNRLSRQSSSSQQQQQQQLHNPYATDIGSKSLQTLDRHYNYSCQQSPETAKSGYLMVLDKRKGRSNMAWILRHCVILAKDSTLASTPGGTNSTRKPRPFLHLPACLFRMINGNKHTTGHGFSKRNIIEVADKETNVPLVYLQARTKIETRAWLFNLRLYMAYGQQDNAACLLQNCCTDLLSLAPDDNGSGNGNAGHSSPPGEWRGINEGPNNPNSSTSSKAKSVGGGSVAAGAANEDMAPRNVGSSHASIDNDLRTSATHSHPLPIASSLSRLLDSSQQKHKHKHKPPSLVQAVADSASLGRLAPVWLKPSDRCTPCVFPLHIDRHHHHHHHHNHASSNLYTCNQRKKQRKRHLMSSDSTAYTADTGIVSVITAGVVYLQTYLDDQPRPIPHYLHTKKKEGRDGLLSRWSPFIGVLAKCGASVGFFLLDPDDPAKTAPQQHVRMIAELDVQSLSAHDIQPLDDSLFDSSFAFSIRVHQNPASQFNDSMRAYYSHSLAEHFDLEMLAKYCDPDDEYDSDNDNSDNNDDDDSGDSTSVFSRSTMGSRSSSSSSSTDTGDSREGGDICFAVKDPADMPPSLEPRLHTKEDVFREGTGEARWTFVEGKRRIFTDTSDRKERSKSLGDLGNLISPEDTDNDRRHSTKLETAAPTEEEGHVKPHLGLRNSNTHAIGYARETTHPLPYVLYMSTTRANERSSWIHHLRRFSRIAMLSKTINNSRLPQQQQQHQIAIDFRIERSLWIGVCEIRGLSQQEPGREAKPVPAVSAMLSLDGCPIASCSVSCVQQVNGVHRESPVHQFLFCSLPPIHEGVAIVLQSNEERENKQNDGDEEEGLSTGMASNIGAGLLGYCHIPVPFMQRESTYDGWYPISYGPVGAIDKRLDPYIALASNVKPAGEQLCTAAGQKIHDPKQQQQVYDAVPSAPFRSGDVRVQVRYNELVVLAQPFYSDIIDHLFEANPTIVFDIAVGLPRSADWVVETMTKIALANNRFESWIEALVRHEVLSLSVRDPALIFRGASVTTRAMDTLMKVCGLSFLDQMIGDIVRAIVDSEHRCEVDPTKLSSGESLDNHWEMLTRLLQALWQAIEESKDWCPVKMRRVFYRIRRAILGVYTDDVTTSEGDKDNSSGGGGNGGGGGTAQGNVQYSCISGFLFLRLLCPAMLSPRAFGLVNRAPSTPSLRTLTLLAKGIQCTANLTDFSQKEPYMQPMNSIIQQSIPKMKSFIDYVASNDMLDQQTDSTARTAAAASAADTGLAGSPEAVDGERELAALCVFLSGAREEIQEMVASATAVYSRPPALATTQRPPFASDLRGGSVSGPTSPTTALDSAIDLSQLSEAAVSAEPTTAPPSSPTSIKTAPLSVAADSNPSEVADAGGNSNPLAIISPNGSNGNGGSRGLTHHFRPFRKVSDGQIPARRMASHAMMLDVAYQTSATSLPAMPKREAGKIHHQQQQQQQPQQQPAQPPWAAKAAEMPVFKQSSLKGIEELLRLCQIVQNYSDICKRN